MSAFDLVLSEFLTIHAARENRINKVVLAASDVS